MKENKGITLVALVVTIIILLILAGISIMVLTQTGMFDKANLAKQKSEEAQKLENSILEDYENKIEISANGSRETSNSKIFLDTSNVIGCVGQSTDWCNDSYSYTATEDCAIMGRIGTNSGGSITILINSIDIGYMRTINSFSYSSINYYLKKGDTIEIRNNKDGTYGTSYVQVYAYGLK